MKRFDFFLGVILLFGSAARADEPDKLTIVSWGGAYEAAQRATMFKPFTVLTGVEIEIVTYAGGLEGLRQQAGQGEWDVIDMAEGSAIAACEDGLLSELDPHDLLTPPRHTTLEKEFLPDAFRPCSIAQNIFSTVFAYDERAFPGEKPSRIADFFDVDKFPGLRALKKEPAGILEWALMAEGIPRRQVYNLLSTDRGMRVALRKLDSIRPYIVWWQEPGQPPEMLRDRKVVMASGYNGRFFAEANENKVPLTIVWDGQIQEYAVWAIPVASGHKELAGEFIRFATAVDRMAELAEHISYGPTRRSVLTRIGRHWRSQVPMRDHLPNAPRNNRRSLRSDSTWYAHTEQMRNRWFEAWLDKGPVGPPGSE